MRNTLISAAAIILVISTPAFADDIPKFSSTCVPDYGKSSKICLSSDGKAISSSYMFRKTIATKGSHTGCSATGSSIKCSGGQYRTSQGNGAMNPVVVTLKGGKPVSIAWR